MIKLITNKLVRYFKELLIKDILFIPDFFPQKFYNK